jgi:ribosomal protein S18 acetylase RimI-like enzyme
MPALPAPRPPCPACTEGRLRLELSATTHLADSDHLDFVLSTSGTVRLVANEDEDERDGRAQQRDLVVGEVCVERVLGDAAAAHGLSPYEVCDAYSSDLEAVAAAVYDPRTGKFRRSVDRVHVPFSLDLLHIQRICLLPAYRGRGLGLRVLRRLVQLYAADGELVVLKPSPLPYPLVPSSTGGDREAVEPPRALEQATAKLRKHWSRADFERVGRSAFYAASREAVLAPFDETWVRPPCSCAPASARLSGTERQRVSRVQRQLPLPTG